MNSALESEFWSELPLVNKYEKFIRFGYRSPFDPKLCEHKPTFIKNRQKNYYVARYRRSWFMKIFLYSEEISTTKKPAKESQWS